MKTSAQKIRQQIRLLIWTIIIGLFISGVTAFPLEYETHLLAKNVGHLPVSLQKWLKTVGDAIADTNNRYPYLSYGTDWLAFAHIMLAILFIGPLKDPIKNKWIIEFGIVCCVSILPLALIAGNYRTIPFFWQLIDCSFGIIASIPLFICLRNVKKLEQMYYEI